MSFKLRVDVTFSKKNTPKEVLEWLENKYKSHAGTKADFLRNLITDLYNEKVEDDNNKEELKQEVLGYVLSQLKAGGIEIPKEQEEELFNDVTEDQKKQQDNLLKQF